MKEARKIVRFIMGFVIGIFLFITVFQLALLFSVKFNNAQGIQNAKNAAYTMYNEGLAKYGYAYDKIMINSPEEEDREIAFNSGIKYVTYPDLLQVEVSDYSKTIKYDGTFKSYDKIVLDGYYIEILVDREHVGDITYYEYRQAIDWKTIIKNSMIYAGILLMAYIVMIGIFIMVEHVKTMQKKRKKDNDSKQEETRKSKADNNKTTTKKAKKKK